MWPHVTEVVCKIPCQCRCPWGYNYVSVSILIIIVGRCLKSVINFGKSCLIVIDCKINIVRRDSILA